MEQMLDYLKSVNIEDEDMNALQDTIGITNSTDINSHDYLIRHGNGGFDITMNSLTATSGVFSGYISATGFSGNSSSSDTATALASDPPNCPTNQVAIGTNEYASTTCVTLTENYLPENFTHLTVSYIDGASTSTWSGQIQMAGFVSMNTLAESVSLTRCPIGG